MKTTLVSLPEVASFSYEDVSYSFSQHSAIDIYNLESGIQALQVELKKQKILLKANEEASKIESQYDFSLDYLY